MNQLIIDYSNESDETLLGRFSKNNDTKAIGIVFERHQACAYNIAYKYTRNQADAEDAVQKAFLNVMRFASKQNEFQIAKAWIMKIVINTCKNEISQKVRRKNSNMHINEQIKSDDFLNIEENEQREILLNAVNQLPEKLKWPVWFTYYENMTTAEISKCLEKSESTIRSQVLRGLELLENMLSTKQSKINSATIILLLAHYKKMEVIPSTLSPKINSILNVDTISKISTLTTVSILKSKVLFIFILIGFSLTFYFFTIKTNTPKAPFKDETIQNNIKNKMLLDNSIYEWDFKTKDFPEWLYYDVQNTELASEKNEHGSYLRIIDNKPCNIQLKSNLQKGAFQLDFDMRIRPDLTKNFRVTCLTDPTTTRITTLSINNHIDPFRWINVKVLVFKNMEVFYYNNALSVIYVYENNFNNKHSIQADNHIDIDNIKIKTIPDEPFEELKEFKTQGINCLNEKNISNKIISVGRYKNIKAYWNEK